MSTGSLGKMPDESLGSWLWDILRGIGVWLVIIVFALGIPGAIIWSIVEFRPVQAMAVIFLAVVFIAEIVKVFTKRVGEKEGL